MKLMKNWKRIIAGFMAFTMVFLSVDGGCITALAAEIQKRNNEQEITVDLPTGYVPVNSIAIDIEDYTGEIYDYQELANVETFSETEDDAWDKYSTNYFYNQLSDEWKEVWEATDALCRSYLTSEVDAEPVATWGYFLDMITLPENTLMADGNRFIYLFMESNPQYYFLESNMLHYPSDDKEYMYAFCLGVYDGFADGEARAVSTGNFKTAIDTVLSEEKISATASDSVKLKYVYDYVMNKVSYYDDILDDAGYVIEDLEESAYTQSAYSTLCLDKTVCAGYAEAVQLLCNGLGVDALSITSVDHMWNKVRINDCWYNVDATWDDGQSFYLYYGRNDAMFNASSSSHIAESLWDGYLPACVKDTNPDAYNGYKEPGTFYVPTVTLPTPVIEVTLNEEENYDVTITMDENYSNATIYYTIDGTEPSVAATKSLVYRGEFTVEPETVIQAIAVWDQGYYDSAIASKKALVEIENVAIQSHFYKELTFTWDALDELVDGYIINVYNGSDNTKIGQSIEISGGDTNFYVYDTTELTTVASVYYEIYGYRLGEGQNKNIATNTVKTTKCDINVLTSPLDVDVKWHVTTSDGVKYLVINVEEGTQQQLCLWYYTDKNGVKLLDTFTLNMTEGVNAFKYTLDSHGIAYDEVGYIYITDSSKTTAFQKDGFTVGGEYKEPVLESIPDINLETSGQTAVLEAVIKDDSLMENFNYKYQWYVADDATSVGTKIDGATNATYTVQIGSFDVKYYYCEVTTEYLEKKTFETNNGTKSEDLHDNHTRVEGALYETEISYEPIKNRVFTGGPITVDDLVIKNGLGNKLVLGRDYNISYENNESAGEATIIVDFIGDYDGIDDDGARIHFIIEAKPVSVDSEEFEFTDVVTNQEYIYNGAEHVPPMVIKDLVRNYSLIKDTDYTIEYRGNVDAGTATIVMKFKGNYKGEEEILFKIKSKTTENVVISPIRDYVYTGKAIIPELTIIDNDISKNLVVGKDYEVSCVNNIAVGGATVTVKFIKNYKGDDKEISFNIVKKNAADDDVLITAIPDQEYTGSEIKPALKVIYNDMILTEGTDYTTAYVSNEDIGQATITLTFRKDYYGTKTTTFNIVARKAENLTYSEIIEEYTYDGTVHEPVVEVRNGENVLESGKDYVISYEDNIAAGTGKVIVSFDGFDGESKYYTGEKVIEFEIGRKNILSHLEDIEVKEEKFANYTYNGAPYEPEITIIDKGIVELNDGDENYKSLEQDVDFQVSYENNINAGTATIIIDFKGNYEGHIQRTFIINPKEISQDDIEVEAIANQTYSGKMLLPSVVVKEKNSDVILRANEDYTVSAGSENVYVGTGTVVISIGLEGNYNYTGENIEVDFKIVPRNSANVKIDKIPNQTYTGSAITPDLIVKDGDIVLIKNHDYHVTYSNNINVGTATVTITFDGNFTGDAKTATFTIIDPIPTSITSSVFSVDQTRNYISKITVGTTAHTLLSNLKENKYVSMRDKNGAGISGATILGTGMKACIMDGNTVDRTYIVIVTGDTNGDGKINITDMIAIKACTLKKSGLSGAYEKAGDVNGDGKINITDFIKVKATTLKKDTITGVAVK